MPKRSLTFYVFALGVLSVYGCAAIPVIGDGNDSQRTIEIREAQEINIHGKSDIIFTDNPSNSLEIHSDSNIIQRISVRSSGNSITIRPSFWFMLFPSQGIEYRISSAQIEKLTSSGKNQLQLNTSQSLHIHSSGELDIVARGNTELLRLSGSGQLKLEGTQWQAQLLELERSGRTHLELTEVIKLNGRSSGTLTWLPSSITNYDEFQHHGTWNRESDH